tara:strand:+ start:1068 stop:1436 length:369 start_codon:yes stop_codon:yes gene_type:complete
MIVDHPHLMAIAIKETTSLEAFYGVFEDVPVFQKIVDDNNVDLSEDEKALAIAKYEDNIAAIPLNELRNNRDGMLIQTDWTQAIDSPLDDATKASWVTYRQALRDITDSYTSLEDVVWPTKP